MSIEHDCGEEAMLEMKGKCEHCGTTLHPDIYGAMICSFECTFCEKCSTTVLAGRCPNCEGELVKRPVRERREACAVDAIY